MSRGIGEIEPIQQQIPEWLAVIIALLTQLGDIWFLALVLCVLYWVRVDEQDGIAAVAGLWLAGMGLYKGLKEIFAFPRPDEPLLNPELLPWLIQPLYEVTASAGGYGFPSGHAINTTIVYVGLAAVLTVGTRRVRYLIAAAIVATVGFSRIALGVHYLVDIVVGVSLGIILLLTAREVLRRRVVDLGTAAFTLAVGFGAFYVVASGQYRNAIIIFGASLGAFGGWQLVMLGRALVANDAPSGAARPLAIRGGLAAAAFAPLVASLEYFPLLSVYTAGGGVGLLAAVAVTLPIARHSQRARRVGVAVRFWLGMAVLGVRVLLRPRTWRRAGAAVRDFVGRLGQWAQRRWRRLRS